MNAGLSACAELSESAFRNKRPSLARRENKDDSADLMLEDEFIGVFFKMMKTAMSASMCRSTSPRKTSKTPEPEKAADKAARRNSRQK